MAPELADGRTVDGAFASASHLGPLPAAEWMTEALTALRARAAVFNVMRGLARGRSPLRERAGFVLRREAAGILHPLEAAADEVLREPLARAGA
jgi:hypothetical protein